MYRRKDSNRIHSPNATLAYTYNIAGSDCIHITHQKNSPSFVGNVVATGVVTGDPSNSALDTAPCLSLI